MHSASIQTAVSPRARRTCAVVYELRLTNGIPVPVTVTGLSVRAAPGSRMIERLDGDDLAAATSLLATPGDPDVDFSQR